MADGTYKIVILANDDAKRTRGLMFTDPIPDDACALFVFPREADHTFWNKNVNYPLTLAFCDANGIVVAIDDMNAMDETPCRAGSSNVKFVVEARRGALKGVRVGDILAINPSDMTVGFSPRNG